MAKPLPLPQAFSGKMSSDGSRLVYNPLAPAFSFDFTNYQAWGNYKRRPRRRRVDHHPARPSIPWRCRTRQAADFSPVWVGGKVYFLSGRKGAIGVFMPTTLRRRR